MSDELRRLPGCWVFRNYPVPPGVEQFCHITLEFLNLRAPANMAPSLK